MHSGINDVNEIFSAIVLDHTAIGEYDLRKV